MQLELGKSYITKNRAWKVTPIPKTYNPQRGDFRCQVEILIPGFEHPIISCDEDFITVDDAEETGGYVYLPDGRFGRINLDTEMDWDIESEYTEESKTIETNWDSFLFAEEK